MMTLTDTPADYIIDPYPRPIVSLFADDEWEAASAPDALGDLWQFQEIGDCTVNQLQLSPHLVFLERRMVMVTCAPFLEADLAPIGEGQIKAEFEQRVMELLSQVGPVYAQSDDDSVGEKRLELIYCMLNGLLSHISKTPVWSMEFEIMHATLAEVESDFARIVVTDFGNGFTFGNGFLRRNKAIIGRFNCPDKAKCAAMKLALILTNGRGLVAIREAMTVVTEHGGATKW